MRKFNFYLLFLYFFISRSHNSSYYPIKKDEKAFLLSHLCIYQETGGDRALESGLNGAVVLLVDEVLGFLAVEGLHELLQFRTVFIAGSDSYDVRIGELELSV